MNFVRVARIMGELKGIKPAKGEKDADLTASEAAERSPSSHKKVEVNKGDAGKNSLLEFLSTKVQVFTEFEDMSSFAVSILRASSYPFFIVDKNMKIQFMNPACLNFTGLSLNDVVGKVNCTRVFNSNLCEKKCAIKQAMTTQQPVIGKRVKVLDKFDREHTIIVTAGPLMDKRGRVLGGFEVWRDAMPDEEVAVRNKKLLDMAKNYCREMDVFFQKIEKKPLPRELENNANWEALIAGMRKQTRDFRGHCDHFMKSSCWDVLNCPPERQVQCPAFPNNGKKCWEVDYTWCEGQMQGTASRKKEQCKKCFVYIKEQALK